MYEMARNGGTKRGIGIVYNSGGYQPVTKTVKKRWDRHKLEEVGKERKEL
jgi:hypothetical protein